MGSLAEPGKTQHDPGHVEGRGAFAQGHKDPVTDSLSGYVSVSPHHTHNFLPGVWNVILIFPGEVVLKVTEVSLQVAGEKPHIRQFAQGFHHKCRDPCLSSPIKAVIGTEVSRREGWAGQTVRDPIYR